MTKSFRRIGNTNYTVAHNGQNVWDATIRLAIPGAATITLAEKAPVTWAKDVVKLTLIPVYFKDTELGRSNMEAFILAKGGLVVTANGKVNEDGVVCFTEATRIAEVVFDHSVDIIETRTFKDKIEHVVWVRLVKYIA